MTSIEVPKIESLAAVGDPLENVLAAFHFLLTSLFRYEEALLHADYHRPAAETAWHLRRRVDGEEGEDELVAAFPSAMVQSCAARLAVIMEMDHRAGGNGRLLLKQGERRHECRVFLSNCRESGVWVRIYGRVVP